MKLLTILCVLVVASVPTIMAGGGENNSKNKHKKKSKFFGLFTRGSTSKSALPDVCPEPAFYQKIKLPHVFASPTELEIAEGITQCFLNFVKSCSAKPDIAFLELRGAAQENKSIVLNRGLLPGEFDDLNNICNEINALGESFERAHNTKQGYQDFENDNLRIRSFVRTLKNLYDQSSTDPAKQKSISLVCYDLHTLMIYMKALFKEPPKSMHNYSSSS
ncbi:uncharacterized protein LOC116345457 isoform X2 [Contarinia nasturtii]|uniref:uncharacterized protein LOC116345457 isoform X2 n=1 Tax=Contarinia nasturtii TaxID=265458 RepID=UPI0012D3B4FC|nr:uncharacterized protein LOC116345457 isoform X2 [Contarinia nasturtii]